MTPQRIQLSRKKGWRLPPNTVKVDRSTKWGNPYRVDESVDMVCTRRWGFTIKHTATQAFDRADAVILFHALLAFDDGARHYIRSELAGKNLACWCPLPKDGEQDICHAAVLLRIANEGVR